MAKLAVFAKQISNISLFDNRWTILFLRYLKRRPLSPTTAKDARRVAACKALSRRPCFFACSILVQYVRAAEEASRTDSFEAPDGVEGSANH